MASIYPRLRIAVVQFAPRIGHVEENIARAHAICANIQPRSLDLLVLPEMIFSGYVFRDAASISPFLEHPHTGPTSRFCAEMAEKLHCYVVAGYPERLEQSEITKRSDSDGHIVDAIGANSAVVHDPDGERIGGYRKTNLFETDQTWAKPGTGFVTFNLPAPLNTVSLGICMDLNPQPPAVWTLEDGPYEIADYCRANGTDLLILLNAWLDSGVDEDTAEDWHTLNYWASRLRPLWAHTGDGGNQPPATIEPRRTVAIVCNRCGEENDKKFAGSSALFALYQGRGRPIILQVMERTQEGVGNWTV